LAISHEIKIAGERGNSEVIYVAFETAETLQSPYPKRFSGRFMHLSAQRNDEIRFAPKVAMGFKQKPYVLDSIRQDGSFTVHRDWLDDTEEFLLRRRLSTREVC
jgi:hypothetical protein